MNTEYDGRPKRIEYTKTEKIVAVIVLIIVLIVAYFQHLDVKSKKDKEDLTIDKQEQEQTAKWIREEYESEYPQNKESNN